MNKNNECSNYNKMLDMVYDLCALAGNTPEAIQIRDRVMDCLTINYSQPLMNYLDLQEQLGCPLEVVFKALTNGVYYEDVANCMKYMVVDLHLNLEGEYVLYFDDEEYLLTKNYKKTWFLRKDKK